MKKLYEFNDNLLTTKTEKKHLYKSIMNFNEYFYTCYRNMKNIDRTSYGDIILKKTSNMLSIMCSIYFLTYDKIFCKKLYMLSKDIEFHIRLCYRLQIFSKKQIITLSKIITELSTQIKDFENNNELCKS